MNEKLVWFGLLVLFFGGLVFMYFQYTGLVAENNKLYYNSQKALEALAHDTNTDLNKWRDCQLLKNITDPHFSSIIAFDMSFENRDCGLND